MDVENLSFLNPFATGKQLVLKFSISMLVYPGVNDLNDFPYNGLNDFHINDSIIIWSDQTSGSVQGAQCRCSEWGPAELWWGCLRAWSDILLRKTQVLWLCVTGRMWINVSKAMESTNSKFAIDSGDSNHQNMARVWRCFTNIRYYSNIY